MNASERDARVEAEIAAPLREASPALDELHRARLMSAIDAALDREDEARPTRVAGRDRRAAARRRWRIVAAGGRRGGRALDRPPTARATRAGAAAAAGWERSRVAPPVSPPPRPCCVRISSRARRAAAEAPAPTTSLVALRGERARATIGTRVRLTLVGAGRVSVLAAARDGDIELALDGGRLLVDYDGQTGGTLRVRSPGAITTVVGTVFAVEVDGRPAAASR